MNRTQQLSLLEELLGLKEGNALFLDEQPTSNPVQDYIESSRFELEQARIFRKLPSIVAHSSELPGPNSFLRRTANGLPLLLMRGDDGNARLFLNVCRHRGTRLVDDDSGCRKRFSCPYHAWTWNSRGEFVGAPHFESGFPGVDRKELGLKPLSCTERHGFIWRLPEDGNSEIGEFLSTLDTELQWVGTEHLTVHQSGEQLRQCNWKLLPEGGLEAYHFRVAHRNTIAKLFNNNLSSYQRCNPHIRSVLPRASIMELRAQDQKSWDIRQHANILYTVFPTSMLLVQSDHVIWICLDPIAAELTKVRLVTLKPEQSTKSDDYWDKNHALTVKTLNEDFDLAESIQCGMASGANDVVRFGRFEGALNRFNETVREYIGSCDGS